MKSKCCFWGDGLQIEICLDGELAEIWGACTEKGQRVAIEFFEDIIPE